MGKINPISEDLLRVMRREARKHGVTLVLNKKTGTIFFRQLTDHAVPPTTEAQSISRNSFTERSQKAALWIKTNDEKACPPDGTPEYQRMMKSFKRQDKVKRLLNFVMSKAGQLEVKNQTS